MNYSQYPKATEVNQIKKTLQVCQTSAAYIVLRMFSGLLQNNRSMISIHAPPLNKIDGHNLSIRMAQLPLILKMALGNTKKLMESTT